MTRLVLKLGSSSIASGEGLALDVVADLVTQIAAAQRDGHEVILVTSGAARLGRRLLAFEGPTARAAPELQRLVDAVRLTVTQASGLQALEATLGRYGSTDLAGPLGVALAASVGQPALMALYRQLAAAVGMEVCQILLSRSDLDSAEAMRDVGRILVSALEQGLLPVVNGNDTTDPKSELDNDQVAVAVAVAAQASRLTFRTNVRAVYGDGRMRDRISRLTPEEARSIRISAPGEGRGGMRSKLNAAARAAAGRLAPGERWVGGIAYPMGTIGINREAERSLRTGSTLFLSGVKRVDGEFEPGSVVELVDVRHPERLIGRGSVAVPAAILRLLRALTTDEVADALSILFRLRHAPALRGAEEGAEERAEERAEEPAGGRASSAARLLDPGQFEDVADLARRGSLASRQAHAELTAATPGRVRTLTDALLRAHPRACAAILAEGSFLAGKVSPGSPARRAVRDMHAIHRDSLVVFRAT